MKVIIRASLKISHFFSRHNCLTASNTSKKFIAIRLRNLFLQQFCKKSFKRQKNYLLLLFFSYHAEVLRNNSIISYFDTIRISSFPLFLNA